MIGEPPRLPAPPERKLLLPRPKKSWHPWRIAVIALLILAAVFLIGYLPRRKRERTVQDNAEREATAIPGVNVTTVQRSAAISTLLLPGNINPYTEAYLFARATGYVVKRYVDIGDRVREGQPMADIDAPDLDAQVDQARATLAQAQQQVAQSKAAYDNAIAQEDLAKVTWERYAVLVTHGAVSRQDADTQLANYRTAQANVQLQAAGIRTAEENVRAARASLDRLVALQDFKHVRAPFNGIVTARNFDIGAFINGNGASSTASTSPMGGTQLAGQLGTSGASGSPAPQTQTSTSPTATGAPPAASTGELFRVAQIDRVRVLVNVPQENAPTVRAGQAAYLMVREYANRKFDGAVTRTSSSLDQATRTLLTEVQFPNPRSQLLPGMFAQVRFTDTRPSPPLLVPGDSIITNANGLQIAVLGALSQQDRQKLEQRFTNLKQKPEQQIQEAKKVHLQIVEVGRDYGIETEITSGLHGGETVIVNPGDEVKEGAIVVPRAAAQVQGQEARPNPSQPNRQPGGIGSPSMEEPTLGSDQQKKGQDKGKGSKK